MTDMATDSPAHAKRSTPGKSRADVWFVLILTGGTSAILQMWHATHTGGTVLLIAGLVGIVPAATAIGLSHVVASHKSAVTLRVVTFLVMIAAMIVSIGAVAAVVRPIEGRYFSWVFGLALDAAALACVWVLLGDSERKAAEASAVQVAEREAREARESARQMELELAEVTGRSAGLATELTAAKAALDALRSAAPPSVPGRSQKPRKSARGVEDTQDMTTELRAMQMLDAHPELKQKGMGSELARRLGIHPSYGRKLHARLTGEERPADRVLERSGAVGDERTGERSRERGVSGAPR